MYNSLSLLARAYIPKHLTCAYSTKIRSRKIIPNPGIQKRLNVLEDTDLENIDIDDLESDFMSVNQMHGEYEKEIKHYKEKQKYWIVQRKYFKENKVNFLSWNDKEQIKHLHQTDPDYWTVEKLSESFPALPNVIKKILKVKWNKDESKIDQHDKAVEKNWKLLKSGKLTDLPEDLVKHLKKFSSREHKFIPIKQNNTILPAITAKRKKVNEFSSIIESYEKENANNENCSTNEGIIKNNKTNVLLGSSIFSKNKVHITLDKLKEENVDKGCEILGSFQENKLKEENVDKGCEILESFQGNTHENEIPLSSLEEINKTKYRSELIKVRKAEKAEVILYPEKIKIPKEKYQRGMTYKVNDCYYDDDGEFLYRVPGMY